MTFKYTFAVGHDATESFGGYEGEGWNYIKADTPDIAWLKAKREWDMPFFRLADFRAAAHRADLIKERRYAEIEEPKQYNCKFLQCKKDKY